ncbi:MAG: hypothetical protein M1444_00975 [Patescibacteria group bacterium]|nr:hypothetical protein [Patescibacteria group bacterium]
MIINNYYKQKQIIAAVNRTGNIIGKIEKWEAHEKGILHRALTIALLYKDLFILQHRKHPAFNAVLDITSSSHQIFVRGKLQTALEATYSCLEREWNLRKKDLTNEPKSLGTVYYEAKDPKSIYTEHEMCEILLAEVKELPNPNFDFAYGFSLVKKEELLDKKSRIYQNLAPWVIETIERNML